MTIAEQLEAIRDANAGVLTPAVVVAAAKDAPDSPIGRHVLHVSPDEAAERYYHERAHRLIMRIRFVDPETSTTIRRYGYSPVEQAYVDQPAALAEGGLGAQVLLRAAERQLRDMQRRYGDLAEFRALVERTLLDAG